MASLISGKNGVRIFSFCFRLVKARGVVRISFRRGPNIQRGQDHPSKNGKVTGFDPLFLRPIENVLEKLHFGLPGAHIFRGPKLTPFQN